MLEQLRPGVDVTAVDRCESQAEVEDRDRLVITETRERVATGQVAVVGAIEVPERVTGPSERPQGPPQKREPDPAGMLDERAQALVALRAITYGSGVGLRYGAVLVVISGIVFVVSTYDRGSNAARS